MTLALNEKVVTRQAYENPHAHSLRPVSSEFRRTHANVGGNTILWETP